MPSEGKRRVGGCVSGVTASQGRARRPRDRTALLAAALRPLGPWVRAARLAAALRCALLRRLAARRLWLAIAAFEPEARPARFSPLAAAAPRRGVACRTGALPWPRSKSRSAFSRVLCEACPSAGGLSSTPERRAFERPIAMACCAERAPCLPSRMWWNSSRMNSPAWVVGALPSCLSRRARSRTFRLGMIKTSVKVYLSNVSLPWTPACRRNTDTAAGNALAGGLRRVRAARWRLVGRRASAKLPAAVVTARGNRGSLAIPSARFDFKE